MRINSISNYSNKNNIYTNKKKENTTSVTFGSDKGTNIIFRHPVLSMTLASALASGFFITASQYNHISKIFDSSGIVQRLPKEIQIDNYHVSKVEDGWLKVSEKDMLFRPIQEFSSDEISKGRIELIDNKTLLKKSVPFTTERVIDNKYRCRIGTTDLLIEDNGNKLIIIDKNRKLIHELNIDSYDLRKVAFSLGCGVPLGILFGALMFFVLGSLFGEYEDI